MRVFFCFIILLGLTGCATTSSVHLGAMQTRPAVAWQQVAVYRSPEQVPGKYVEVGLLHTTGDWSMSSEGTIYNSMKKAAGQMGANAIIIQDVIEPGAGAKFAASLFGTPAERKGKALAIYMTAAADTTKLGEAH